MKKIFLSAALLCLSAGSVFPDVYVKVKKYRQPYYDGGRTISLPASFKEVWISGQKAAMRDGGLGFIFDFEKDTAVFINHRTKIFHETALPIDLSRMFVEAFGKFLKNFRNEGSVRRMEEERVVDERRCAGFEVETWARMGGRKTNQQQTRLWLAGDVPLKMDVWSRILINLYRFRNFRQEFIQELAGLRGFPVVTEKIHYDRGLQIVDREDVVEMARKNPSAAVYSPPEGYTRKEKLTRDDVAGLN